MNRPKPHPKPPMPHSKVIEVKTLIKEQVKVLNILKAQRKEIETHIFLAKASLDDIIASELWNHNKRAGKRLAKLQKKEADVVEAIATVQATINRLGGKCKAVRTLCNSLKRAEAQLVRAENGVYDEIHYRSRAIESSENLIRLIRRDLRAFKI